MPVGFTILFVFFGLSGIVLGGLMLVAPTRYPKVYGGLLRDSVMLRQHTETDRIRAIRVQGLIAFASGTFFLFFLWALN